MNGKKEPMMDGRQFHVRVRGVMVLLAAVLVGFLWVLYDLQYVHGAEYLEQSRRKIAKTETVEASRGQILDRYGRVLVGNRASYNVSLDTSFMGEERNAILLRLLEICREESVTWSDTLPVSRSAPYVFTAEGAYGNLRKYAEKMKWDGLVPTAEELEALQSAESPALPSAERLLAKLRETYQVDPALSDGEARDLVGVLYELALRSREITWSSYVFAQDVEMAFIVKVKEASLSGVSIDTTTVREYNTSYAAHLLGRVGLMDSDEWNNIYQALDYPYNASVGKDGMEQAFESYLHGVRASGPSRPTTRARWSVRTTTGRSTSAPASRRPLSPATTSSPPWTSSSRRQWSGPWQTVWAPSNPRTPRARRRWSSTSMTAACWPPPPIPPMICPPSSRTTLSWPTTRSTPCSTGLPRGLSPGLHL